jgi:hypothetical protein
MAAKKVDPLKAKAAKQKKIAIGGAVLLLALLAIQGPKTLKMLQGPQPVSSPTAAATTTPTPAAPASTTPGATAAGEVPAAATAELVSVPDSDQPPVIEDGQLETFERFSSKDPFAQQAQAPPAKPAAAEPPKDDPASEPKPEGPAPAAPDTGSGEQPADGGFTTGTPPAPAEEPVVNATATSIAVNGVAEDVEPEKPFPAAEPTFVLVKLGKDGKSVEIGIAGGSYANGEETLKLRFGKKVTLQNTADGSRYELELLSVAGSPLPKKR